MHIVLFDVDGTLTDSCAMDDACYLRAIRDVFGIDEMVADWSAFEHSTDRGIAGEMVRRAYGREASDAEATQFHGRFISLVKDALAADTNSSAEVRGGTNLLRELRSLDDFAIGIATGGFRETALLKLDHAGYDIAGLALASGSDAISRREILNIALDRTQSIAAASEYRSITYVGDGVWDLRTAAAAGVSFIGVGRGPKADRLRSEGALLVFDDWSNPHAMVDAIRCGAAQHSA